MLGGRGGVAALLAELLDRVGDRLRDEIGRYDPAFVHDGGDAVDPSLARLVHPRRQFRRGTVPQMVATLLLTETPRLRGPICSSFCSGSLGGVRQQSSRAASDPDSWTARGSRQHRMSN